MAALQRYLHTFNLRFMRFCEFTRKSTSVQQFASKCYRIRELRSVETALPKDNKLLPLRPVFAVAFWGVLRVGAAFTPGFIARRSCPSKIISEKKLVGSVLLCWYEMKRLVDVTQDPTLTEAPSRRSSDFAALTPAHFLSGRSIHQFPEPSQPSRSVPLSEKDGT
ncbi:hypothetical protein TNCV_2702311 [Trichonephila clavipes]|nr:hypothetical protein TNCV_2702311 [Trichonephila clavipes]